MKRRPVASLPLIVRRRKLRLAGVAECRRLADLTRAGVSLGMLLSSPAKLTVCK